MPQMARIDAIISMVTTRRIHSLTHSYTRHFYNNLSKNQIVPNKWASTKKAKEKVKWK